MANSSPSNDKRDAQRISRRTVVTGLTSLGALSLTVGLSNFLAGCSGGGNKNGSSGSNNSSGSGSSVDYTEYGAIGSLGLPGLTYGIAFGNGRLYQAYLVPAQVDPSSPSNVVRADSDLPGVDEKATPPIAQINFPGPDASGDFPRATEPFSVAVGPDGTVYAAILAKNAAGNTVQKFDANLTAAMSWDPLAANAGLSFQFIPPVGNPISAVGPTSTLVANPDFIPPQMSVTVDTSGNVYVIDAVASNNPNGTFRVRKFSGTDATLITSYGSGGTALVPAYGKISADSTGAVYVAYTRPDIAFDQAEHAGVYRLNPNGTLDTTFVEKVVSLKLAATTQFDVVSDVTVAGSGTDERVYVLAYLRTSNIKQSLVYVLDTNGNHLESLDMGNLEARDITVDPSTRYLYLNVAYGTFYADSGGHGVYKPGTHLVG